MYLRPKGHSVSTDGWGIETRRDTYTCRHCQHVVEVEPRADPNEFWCNGCMAPICKSCKEMEWRRPPGRACDHFERKLARAEAKNALLRDVLMHEPWR